MPFHFNTCFLTGPDTDVTTPCFFILLSLLEVIIPCGRAYRQSRGGMPSFGEKIEFEIRVDSSSRFESLIRSEYVHSAQVDRPWVARRCSPGTYAYGDGGAAVDTPGGCSMTSGRTPPWGGLRASWPPPAGLTESKWTGRNTTFAYQHTNTTQIQLNKHQIPFFYR